MNSTEAYTYQLATYHFQRLWNRSATFGIMNTTSGHRNTTCEFYIPVQFNCSVLNYICIQEKKKIRWPLDRWYLDKGWISSYFSPSQRRYQIRYQIVCKAYNMTNETHVQSQATIVALATIFSLKHRLPWCHATHSPHPTLLSVSKISKSQATLWHNLRTKCTTPKSK